MSEAITYSFSFIQKLAAMFFEDFILIPGVSFGYVFLAITFFSIVFSLIWGMPGISTHTANVERQKAAERNAWWDNWRKSH